MTTDVRIKKIPHLPRLLEEHFHKLFWCNGNSELQLAMPESITALSQVVGKTTLEMTNYLDELSKKIESTLITSLEFESMISQNLSDVTLLLVSPEPKFDPAMLRFAERLVFLDQELFLNIFPLLQNQKRIVCLSSYGGRALSAALALRDIGLSGYALEGGICHPSNQKLFF